MSQVAPTPNSTTGTEAIRPVPRRGAPGGPRRPPPAAPGDALAREGDRRRPDAGRPARDDAGARPVLGDRLRPPPVRGAAERRPAVPDRDRRPRHPLHPRPVAAPERVAGDHHARLAGLDHRDAGRHRPAHRPDRARRQRGGRVRRRGSVDARLRVLGEADGEGLGSGPHRGRVDRADAAPRVHAVRRAGRRLGCPDHRRDRRQGAAGAARHPLQHARHRPARRVQGPHVERLRDGPSRADRAVGRRAARLRPARLPVHQGRRLRPRDGESPADAVRAGRLARGPRGLDARPRRVQPRGHRPGLRGPARSTTSPGTRSSTTSR